MYGRVFSVSNMVTHSKNFTDVGWGGPWHWELTFSLNGECRIDPRDQKYLGVVVLFIITLILTFTYVSSHILLAAKIAICILSSVAGAGILAVILTVNRIEKRRGPYLVFDGTAICLRHERISLRDFASFEINRRWENTGLGRIKVSYLVLLRRSGAACEIVHSINSSEIVKLKKQLDEKVVPVIVEKLREDFDS